ncbi:MAG: PDZ domain-containing protein [Chloroflexota bacterium]|nr:PDZ domain-containing protein [Chloroflexota bacterium]
MRKQLITGIALLAVAILLLGSAVVAAASPVGFAQQEINPDAGLVIVQVDPDGPAAVAGIVRGDILLEVDGEEVDSMLALSRKLGTFEKGQQVVVTVLHGDKVKIVGVQLGELNRRPYLGLTPFGGAAALRQAMPQMLPAMPEGEVEMMQFFQPGTLVAEVVPDGPAAAAGLEAGAIIIALDGEALTPESDLADIIAGHEPGDSVILEIAAATEDGDTEEITVVLGEHPELDGVAFLGVRYSAMPMAGFLQNAMPFDPDSFEGPSPQRQPFLPDLDFDFPEADLTQGAVVTEVLAESAAALAGLQSADVITEIDGEPVSGPDAIIETIAGMEPGDSVELTVVRQGEEDPLTLEAVLGAHPEEEEKAFLGVALSGFAMKRLNFEDMPHDGRHMLPFGMPFNFEDMPHDGHHMLPFGMPFNFENMPHDGHHMRGFRFHMPFDLDQLPFDLDELPFDLDALPFDLDKLPIPTPDKNPEAQSI